MSSLFTELRRRNVFRVGVAYAVGAWLLLQLTDVLSELLNLPEEFGPIVVALVAIGLPVALFLAWAYELTPEGLKREKDVDRSQSITTATGKKLNVAIFSLMALAIAYLLFDKFSGDRPDSASTPAAEGAESAARQEAQPAPDAGLENVGGRQSVAVLPFMNMSSDAEQEYFSDGITEEIINALVKIPGLSVPARTSVFAYKGRLQDVRQIGSELNVAHVLEGSIRSQGKQVRITAQLIEVESGYHLWSETFDRQLENIFAVQEEIAGAIANVLVGELGVEVAAVPNKTRDMEAYDLYLQGRAALRKRDDSAITLFQEVTRRDPDFAPGWAALAIAHNSIDDDDPAAIEAARRALAMDPDNVDALNAMGASLRDLSRWSEAETYFDRAMAIDPNSAELLEDWAEFLNFVGRPEEALEVTSRAIAIEPGLMPLQQEHVVALLATGRWAPAREIADRILDQTGTGGWFWMMDVWLTPAASGQPVDIPPSPEVQRDGDVSSREQEFLSLMTTESLSSLDESWGLRMRGLIERSLEQGEDASRFSWAIRSALILAGQVDFVVDVFFMANDDTRARSNATESLWTPLYSPVRQHPRFSEFLEKHGLVAYWDETSWPKWCRRDEDGVITCH